jgi:hypothetical protein
MQTAKSCTNCALQFECNLNRSNADVALGCTRHLRKYKSPFEPDRNSTHLKRKSEATPVLIPEEQVAWHKHLSGFLDAHIQ